MGLPSGAVEGCGALSFTGLPSSSGSVCCVVCGSHVFSCCSVCRICSSVPARHMVSASTAATVATAARPHVFCISRIQMVPITAPRAERGGCSSTSSVSRAV